jgi:hypothetical protein
MTKIHLTRRRFRSMGEKIDQGHCPICGREFDIVDLAMHWDARGPSYSYCACRKCKRAWEIGQLRYMCGEIERREVKYNL